MPEKFVGSRFTYWGSVSPADVPGVFGPARIDHFLGANQGQTQETTPLAAATGYSASTDGHEPQGEKTSGQAKSVVVNGALNWASDRPTPSPQ